MPKLLTKHTLTEQADSLADYLPNGDLFIGKKLLGTKLRKLIEGLSGLLVDGEEQINLVSSEYDIRFTELFIKEWEGFVGIPDSCFDTSGTIEQRRKNVLTKLTALGIQTEADFIALAALFGVVVTIDAGSVSGVFPLVFPLIFFPNPKTARFTLIVSFQLEGSNKFPLTFPIPFGSSNIGILECLFNKLKPANVDLIFRRV